MRENTFNEFTSSINKCTLSFKDANLERKYVEEKLSILSINKIILVSLIILFLLLIIRYIEEFIFMLVDDDLIYVSKKIIVVNLVLLALSFIYEVIVVKKDSFSSARGFAMLTSVFVTNTISSYSFDSSGIGFVPTYSLFNLNRTIPSYVLAIVISLMYANQWIVVGLSCIIGLIVQMVFNHLRDYKLCIICSKYS